MDLYVFSKDHTNANMTISSRIYLGYLVYYGRGSMPNVGSPKASGPVRLLGALLQLLLLWGGWEIFRP
jgi:hypothetical protein